MKAFGFTSSFPQTMDFFSTSSYDENATNGNNSIFNLSIANVSDDESMNYCGKPDEDKSYLTLLLVLYSTVVAVGLAGNTLVIFVILKFKWVASDNNYRPHLSSSCIHEKSLFPHNVFLFSKMKTVTNQYILQLALADECFLIGIPFLIVTMHNGRFRSSLMNCEITAHLSIGEWVFGNILCKIYMFSQSITQFSSSIFLLIMSADRYIAGEYHQDNFYCLDGKLKYFYFKMKLIEFFFWYFLTISWEISWK